MIEMHYATYCEEMSLPIVAHSRTFSIITSKTINKISTGLSLFNEILWMPDVGIELRIFK